MEFATWLDRLGTVADETRMDAETEMAMPVAVPAFNGRCFNFLGASGCPIKNWSFGTLKIRPEVSEPQTEVQLTVHESRDVHQRDRGPRHALREIS